jgi:hypothetical protein
MPANALRRIAGRSSRGLGGVSIKHDKISQQHREENMTKFIIFYDVENSGLPQWWVTLRSVLTSGQSGPTRQTMATHL